MNTLLWLPLLSLAFYGGKTALTDVNSHFGIWGYEWRDKRYKDTANRIF